MFDSLFKLIEFFLYKLNAADQKISKQGKAIRKLILFIYGVFIGLIFYHSIISNIEFSQKYQTLVVASVCFLCALMCMISIQFRCISVLMLLGALGKAGRSLIKTIIIALLLAGPIANIIQNSIEVTRVFECTTSLTFNLTRNKVELAFIPFINAFTHMESNLSSVQDSLNEITHVVGPIVQEIEGNENFTRSTRQSKEEIANIYAKNYQHKLKTRCEQQFERGAKNCEKAFQRVYDECFEKAPPIANYIVCAPLKIDFICNAGDFITNVGVGANICDSSRVIDAEFGNEYFELRKQEMKFMSDYSNISFNYKVNDPRDFEAMRLLNETGKELSQELNEKVKLMDGIFRFCSKLLILIYLKIIYDAIEYHDNFLKNINFNNYYITDYFKKIDRRRTRSGLKRLLPIKNVEIDKVVDLSGSQKLRKEFQGYFGLTLNLLLHVIASTFFIILDRLFYELLNIISLHSRIHFEQEGVHHLNVTINGTGFVANLIRASIDGFNVNKHVQTVMTNEACLPQPTLLNTTILMEIYLLFLLNLYLIYNQVYIHRFKRSICAFFYPKREKKRIFYLYNKTLQQRKQLFRTMTKTLRYRMKVYGKIENSYNFFQKTLNKFPRLCKCLRFLSLARSKCFICHVIQSRKWTKDSLLFWQCADKNCQTVYCEQCWMEIARKCLVCRIRQEHTNGMSDSEIM
ncbi:hypothetical protein PVAND_003476 [Polypedilum vanderplanki]|uniref:Dendritic cell-specific transmembrane protein-like domain-containing protein n=1 Tax=Polypedilum vanderplanki TaxID=319348 RepID=A0A9J6BU65_POLVA|nr:hypothetical protein PVAND_003476 [Polypedilum vanderplanki]